MTEVEQALKKVRAAAKRLARADAEQADAKLDRDVALQLAQEARATWEEMMQASGISRPTLAKALRRQ